MPVPEGSAGAGAVVLVVSGPIAPDHVPRLCERVRTLLQGGDADLLVCGVGAVVHPDAVTIDALARMALIVRRLGRRVWLCADCDELRELLALAGLEDVLPCSAVELGGEAELREDAVGVEEEGDPGDPVA